MNLVRAWLTGVASLAMGTLSDGQSGTRSACVTVVDATGTRGISGALVRSAVPDSQTPTKVVTPMTGRACIAGIDTAAVRVDAIGYYPVWVALATRAIPAVRLELMAPGVMLPEWGASQMVAGIEQVLRRPEVARDSGTASVLTEVLRNVEHTHFEMRTATDSAGVLMLGYVDLAADGSRYSELRLRHNKSSISLGMTTMQCADRCGRESDVVIFWRVPDDGAAWAPAYVAKREGEGDILRSAFDRSLPDTLAVFVSSRAPQRAITGTVRGMIFDQQKRPLVGIEVFSADGSASTLTDARGAYQLAVTVPAGGALLSTRRLGWAPMFRTVKPEEGQAVEWSPVLESTAVLATQLVRATGVPEVLRSFRYNDFLARRSKGTGQFFIGEEIWSAVSIGDVVNRAHGIRARFTHGSNLSGFVVPSCPPRAGAVGVYVNGIDETGLGALQRLDAGAQTVTIAGSANPAAQALANYVTSAIVGLEIFIGRTELPAEFGDPRYCAVISLWTR